MHTVQSGNEDEIQLFMFESDIDSKEEEEEKDQIMQVGVSEC